MAALTDEELTAECTELSAKNEIASTAIYQEGRAKWAREHDAAEIAGITQEETRIGRGGERG